MKSEPIHGPTSADITPTERIVAALWTEVLELAHPPHAADNFFSLGGDSMAAVTLEFRIHEELSIHLLPGAVFGSPTLSELSHVVDNLLASAEAARDSLPSAPGGPAPGSVAQS